MKFIIVINRWANFYFFIQNFSLWHFSNRPAYNEFWRKELGELSLKEKEGLKLFTRLHKRYPFGEDFFGQFFFTNNHPLVRFKQELPAKDFALLNEIFLLFRPRFHKLYKKELPLLKKWERALIEHLNETALIKRLNLALSSLYRTGLLRKTIKVYLLFSAPYWSGGGANADGNSITLEISRRPLRQINQAIGIIWHELIHVHFERHYFLPLLNKKFRGDQAAISLIKEVTASSLLPNGVLGKTLLNVHSRTLNVRMPSRYNRLVLNLTEEYAEKNKFFDKDYITLLHSITTQLKGKLK